LFNADILGGGVAAYRIRVSGEYIYIANKKIISIYHFDSTLSEQTCVRCEEKCSLRKNIK
jgi:hypothetical protein